MMKPHNNALQFILIFILSLGVWQCTSSKKTTQTDDYKFHGFSGLGDVYCQSWSAGIKGGRSGIAVFIPVISELPKDLILDSIYFRRQVTKLEIESNDSLVYIGRFKTIKNQSKDIIMSSNPNDEYGNTIPSEQKEFPFNLLDTECVVSYLDDGERYYYKISNVIKKAPIGYPSTSPNKQ